MSDVKHHRWLQQQLSTWQQQDLLSAEQVENLRQRYPVAEGVNWPRLIMSAFGGLIFGLGVILFFAYNWQDMHRYSKLAVIFIALALAHAGAIWHDKKQHHGGAEGLALLATVLFGAAIWLISQIYHIDEHYPNAFLAWGLAAYGLAWARGSILQAICAAALMFAWSGLEIIDFNQKLHYSPLLMMVLFWPLLYRLAMPWLMTVFNFFVSLFAMITLMMWQEEQSLVIFYGASFAFMLLGYLLVARQDRFATSFLLPGFVGYFISLYAFTFVDVASELHRINQVPMWLWIFTCLTVFALPIAWQLLQKRVNWHLALAGVTSVWAMLMVHTAWLPSASAYAVNLIVIGHCLVLVRHSIDYQKISLLLAAVALFLITVFTRYVDLFESLLLRAVVFLLAGAAIFAISNYYQRNKKADAATEEPQA